MPLIYVIELILCPTHWEAVTMANGLSYAIGLVVVTIKYGEDVNVSYFNIQVESLIGIGMVAYFYERNI